MISLSQSLLRGQRARTILDKQLLIRCVLTYGANEYEYTKTRIKKLSHTEQTFSHGAELLLGDNDKTLHNLDLEGYKAVFGYGLITRAGEEWIDTAPLWVVGQDRDSYPERLECLLELEGIFDRMGRHKAESTLTLESTDTQTVKDLLTGIADCTLTDGTNTPYTNFPIYSIVFDTGYDADGLIDVFCPADGFRINVNETRLAKFKELLRYTNCVARIGNDGAIHIFIPTTSGTTYDQEYTLTYGRDYHNFFSKRFRRRIVSPNYIIFKSYGDTFSGYAKDASADLTDMYESETHYARAIDDPQCTALAGAWLSKKQMEAEKGSFVLPFVHFGQETYDYVNLVDARAGDERAGNIGYLTRYYEPGQFNMYGGFGRVPLGVPALEGLASETGLTIQNLMPLFDSLYSYVEQIIDVLGYKVDIDDFNQQIFDMYDDAYFRKVSVSQTMKIPAEAA